MIILKKLVVLLLVLWMGVIFYNTSANGVVSNQRSMTVLNKVRALYHKAEPAPEGKSQSITSTAKNLNTNSNTNKNEKVQSSRIEKLNLIIRKNAHAFEYIVLALLTCSVFFINKFRGKGVIVYVLFICLLYAVSDEFHQLFVPGRTSLVSDVMIDFSGALVGLGIFYLIYYKVYPMTTSRKHPLLKRGR